MATWKKAVLVAFACLVPSLWVLSQVAHAQEIAQIVQVLPGVEELPDEELIEVEGELWWLIILGLSLLAGAISGYVYYTYDTTPDVMEAAVVGLSVSTVFLMGLVAGTYIPR
jgi:uncharacterized protein YneF (UPF0154 family)